MTNDECLKQLMDAGILKELSRVGWDTKYGGAMVSNMTGMERPRNTIPVYINTNDEI